MLSVLPSCSEVSYDLKCPAQQHCWYCANLCEVCMKPASFGLASEDGAGNVLCFCSQSRKAFERGSSIKEPAFATEVWTPPTAPVPRFRTFPISKTHKTLLCINALGISTKGKYTQINLAICAGDGEMAIQLINLMWHLLLLIYTTRCSLNSSSVMMDSLKYHCHTLSMKPQ